MDFASLAEARHSVRKYTPGVPLDDDTLRRIFAQVRLTPSSFNLQHWRFVVVRDAARKQALRALAFGQQQVEDCSAAVLVCGRLDAHADAPALYRDAPAEMREKFVPMIAAVYGKNPPLQREEAIRSGALAAMSLMYAARDLGWDSGPMIGFDADAVRTALKLPDTLLPVMLVTLGKTLHGVYPARLYRRPLHEVVHLETADGATLAD